MVLADTDNAPSLVVNHHVGVPFVSRRRDGLRCAVPTLAVQSLVVKIGEVYGPVGHGERAAAVLVHSSADVERGGSHVGDLPVGRAAYYHVTPAFPGPHLHPVDVIPVQGYLAQRGRARYYQIRSHRGLP